MIKFQHSTGAATKSGQRQPADLRQTKQQEARETEAIEQRKRSKAAATWQRVFDNLGWGK